MVQALYRKWRPRTWEEVVGQEHVVRTLQNAIRAGRIGHAYLFSGPRGTGKTSAARLLAKAANCLDESLENRPCNQCAHCTSVNESRFLDLIEIDAASNTSVDDVRDLRDKIGFSPTQGRVKVYIIDEVHMLSTAAFNALLKTLEEPPAHAIFILATTEPHKIPATVLSRCQRHEFRRIPVAGILGQLQKLASEENIPADEDALAFIARQSGGAMRDAISLLDQLSSSGGRIDLAEAQQVLGTATSQSVIDLAESMLSGQVAAGLETIHNTLDGGSDARQFGRQVVDYLRGLLLVRAGNASLVEATAEVQETMKRQAKAFRITDLTRAVRLFNQAASDTRGGWHPGLLLELALAEYVEAPPAPAAESQPAPSVRPKAAAPSTGTVTKPLDPAAAGTTPKTAKPPAPPPSQAAPPAATPEDAAPSRTTEAVRMAERTVAAAPAEETPQADTPKENTLGQAADGPALDMAELNAKWKQVHSLVKKEKPPVEALLNSCRILGLKNGTLTLGFVTDVLCSKMSTPENLDLVCRAIQAATGRSIQVTCVVQSGKSGQNPADLDIESDGIVGTALNMGGQIVRRDGPA